MWATAGVVALAARPEQELSQQLAAEELSQQLQIELQNLRKQLEAALAANEIAEQVAVPRHWVVVIGNGNSVMIVLLAVCLATYLLRTHCANDRSLGR